MNRRNTLVIIERFLATMILAAGVHAQTVTGTGTTNYVPVWTSSSKIGDSILYQTASKVGIGTTAPAYTLDISGDLNTTTGYYVGTYLAVSQNVSLQSVGLGYDAINSASTGTANTGTGWFSMKVNSSGKSNTGNGYAALTGNTTGNSNTALGAFSLHNNTTGDSNVAVGVQALFTTTTGASNVAIGSNAGYSLTGSNSNNIDISNSGVGGDSGVVRVGSAGTQTAFFAAGIRGVTTGQSNAVAVVIDSNGQLGTVSSSIRFKEDVNDMADASNGLLRLRPVTYRYKQAYADGSKPVDYGLIAEEVAEVYPDLVARNAAGQIETVQYQKLTPMLLNEVQKLRQLLERQSEITRLLESRLAALELK